ncbi:MAG: filamentous hemagglutinin N-terminal domain-containing protein, partial [Alphaproteobacteria bacterium]|nr:filamentous hemagglutinin N-terminal domain-containing protein [Alphaproteobacteria bacterium]
MRATPKRPTAQRILKASLAVMLTVQTPLQVLAQSLPVPATTALPVGGQVAAGSASIKQSGTPTNPVMTIQQGSARTIINWNSFDIGQNARVDFVQPDGRSVALNRVQGSNASQIFGQLSANGQVYLINPNGVYFSPTSTADVGGLVATTMGISDADFLAGRNSFTRHGATGKVINEGALTSRSGGYIALLAPEVRNAGVIVAQSGTVALASGEAVTMNFDPNNSLTNLIVAPSKIDALVENQKIVKAPDGKVIVSAQAFNDMTQGVIKNAGTMSANGISRSGGEIVLVASSAIANDGAIKAKSKAGNGGTVKLDAATVSQNGVIDVSTSAAGGKGGLVMVTGDLLSLKAGSTITANGPAGGGKVLVGGDWQGANGIRQAQSVVMEQGASIQANATQAGDGGTVVLWSDVTNRNGFTRFEGSIEAKGLGGGAGGRVESSGHVVDVSTGSLTATSGGGDNGLWLLDPYDVTIQSSGTSISGSYTAAATTTILASSITTVLNSGTSVTISTDAIGSAGTDAGNISVTSAITKTAGASTTLTLSAANAINISANISTSGNALNLVLDTGGGSGTVSGVLGLGTGKLTKQGAGSVTLSAANTYTGVTTINGGTIVATNATGLGTATGGAVTVNNGGTLDIQAALGTKTITLNNGGSLTTTAGTGSTSSNLALPSNITLNVGGSLSLFGVISGAGFGITKTGTGKLTLSTANTYTGAVTINGGTIVASNVTGLGTAAGGAVTINSGATLDIQINIGSKPIIVNPGGIIASSGGTGNTASNLSLSSDLTINVAGAGSSLTLSGVISGTGYTITKTGSGILTLNAANTFTGNLVLNAGNTYASVASSVDGSGNLSGALGAGANLVIAGGAMTVSAANTVNALSATSGALSLTSSLTFGGDNSSTTFAGSITGSAQLIKNGTGTFLNGSTTTNSSTYVINNGVMKLNSSTAASSSSVTIGANGTLDVNGFNAGAANGVMHLQGSGYNGQGALINSSATASTVFGYNMYWDSNADFLVNPTGNIKLYASYIKNLNTPTIVKTGSGVLDATNLGGSIASNNGVGYTAYFGNNVYNIQQGAATIGNQYSNATLGNVVLSNGATVTIAFSGTQSYGGVISGNGNVVYSTNATATISGNSTYTGSTTISGTAITLGASTHYTNGMIDYSPLGSTPVVSLANLAAASLAIGANTIELYALSGGGSTGGNLNLGTGALTVGTGNTNT